VDEQVIDDYKHGWHQDARLRLHAMLTAAEMEIERTRLLVRTETPAVAIRHVLEREQPELLTIGASRWLLVKRLLIGSVTDSLLRTAMCDVLVIPNRYFMVGIEKSDPPRPPRGQRAVTVLSRV
jgi:nucleotide-binding universal stress UspA family protein